MIVHHIADTIVAVSSPVGGVRSIIRITGPQTLSVCERAFEPSSGSEISSLTSQISNRAILAGAVRINGDLAVDVLLYLFIAPHSYTGEDLAEMHVHASACLVEALLANLLAQGLRAAGPGEFTARAYLNGKLDLAQAEAVNEVISSSNSLQLEAAERLLGGRLTKATEAIRSALLDVLSLIEAGLDFSGEDIEFISAEQAGKRLADIQSSLEELLAGSIRCEMLMDLPAVGIAGAPNAGKSSLLNALLGWERSIVSAQAKTTRDVLTGVLTTTRRVPARALLKEASHLESVGWGLPHRFFSRRESWWGKPHPTNDTSPLQPAAFGLPFQCVLFDCAGLMPSPDSVLDELVQQAAVEALQRCDAVLFCVDSAKAEWGEDIAIRSLIRPKALIHVATKSDLSAMEELPRRLQDIARIFDAEFLPVSAKTGHGLEPLVEAIGDVVHGPSPVRSVPAKASRGTHGRDPPKADATHGRDAHATETPYSVTTNEDAPPRPTETDTNVVALTARHRQAVTEAIENVRQAVAEVQRGHEEVAVMMIRSACQAISGLERQPLDEQVLDRIFSRFCVGK